jgi:hypothetical protein
MLFKTVSSVFIVSIILAMVEQTWTGPAAGVFCYWTCMTACIAGAGAFTGLMSAGVATGAGMVYGAAACSVTCTALGATCTALPIP